MPPHLRLRRRARGHGAQRPPARVQPDLRGVRRAGALERGGLRREGADRRRQGADGEPADARSSSRERAARRTRRASGSCSPSGTGARPRSTPSWSHRRLPARPGYRAHRRRSRMPGWGLAVASTSAEASVRAVLEHAVGEDAGGAVRGLRRRHRGAQEAGTRHLPARPRAARRRPDEASSSRTAGTACRPRSPPASARS